MIVIVMGVSGSGKTTVGTLLADALRCEYLEGDALHPPANIEKMSRGLPLTDADRGPWLDAIHAELLDAHRRGRSLVTGCSALRESYRQHLSAGVPVTWVYLRGEPEVIRDRLEKRSGHFFRAEMLTSQLEALEEPRDAIVVDVADRPFVIVEKLLAELRSRPELRIEGDAELLSAAAAEAVAGTIEDAVRASGRCSIAVAGGNTPERLYTILRTRFRDSLPWDSVHLFWTDERYVPPDDPRSNYRMVRETLLADLPVPAGNIHPMSTDFPDAEIAAREAEREMRRHFHDGWLIFDLMLLGLGTDGHTASLFPGSPALAESERWVVTVPPEAGREVRLTLTLPVLLAASRTYFLVTGAAKAGPVAGALAGCGDSPAAVIQREGKRVVWWLDEAAAGGGAGGG